MREHPIRPVVGVGVVEKEKAVLVKRGSEPCLEKWSFSGGVVNLGETIGDAAIREI